MGQEQEVSWIGGLLAEQGRALVLYARQWCVAAEDVVQEAFIKLMCQVRPPAEPVAWLYRVVRNGARQQGRAERRRRYHEGCAGRQRGRWFEAEECGDGDEEAVQAGLSRLPLRQREVIVAHVWGGLSFAAIGRLLGCGHSTAHREYLAGLQQLRQYLEEREGSNHPKQQQSLGKH
jgi:RNA polymerase sigma factor (sigma-70 family)